MFGRENEGMDNVTIVTTNWETPTPHDTFPVLYVRTNNTDNEVKSSLVRFTGLNLPANAQIVKAELSLYYSGQSVNAGDMTVYVSGPQRPWLAPQTTWVAYSNGQFWQATGAKGTEDRGLHSHVRTVRYTEVGSWLSFDVTDLAQQGVYEFLLFGSYAGVNKDIQFPSDEYWDAFKRPKLVITYTS